MPLYWDTFGYFNAGAMHFVYYINRLTTRKVDSTYLGLINRQCITYMSVAGLERMATRSVAKCLTLSRHTGRPI